MRKWAFLFPCYTKMAKVSDSFLDKQMGFSDHALLSLSLEFVPL